MSEEQKEVPIIGAIRIVKYNEEVEASGKRLFGELIGKILRKKHDSSLHEFYYVSYIRGEHIGAVEISIIDGGDNHSFCASVCDKAIALRNIVEYEEITLEQGKKEIEYLLHSAIFKFIKKMVE